MFRNSQPIKHVERNIIFARSTSDVWAVYRVQQEAYPNLPVRSKHGAMDYLMALTYRLDVPDIQVMRVNRRWSALDYISSLRGLSAASAHQEAWDDYLGEQYVELEGRNIYVPELYMVIKLPSTGPGVSDMLDGKFASFDDYVSAARGWFNLDDPRGLRRDDLQRITEAEQRIFQRVSSYTLASRASTDQIEWLIRRAYTRHIGEPKVDSLAHPPALAFVDDGVGDAETRWTPDKQFTARLHDSMVARHPRHLVAYSEEGDSFQTHLVLGRRHKEFLFPGPEAELMFAPLDALNFPVDVTFSAAYVSNEDARADVQRKSAAADEQLEEEMYSSAGLSTETMERPRDSRMLSDALRSIDRPPMLDGNLIISVGASSKAELEERVERVRQVFEPVALRRPPGAQWDLFLGTLPGQSFPLADMCEKMTIEEFAAMVPTAANIAGSTSGPYVGYTTSPAHQPIRLDLTEPSRENKPPTVLISGTLGSGKTATAQQLAYMAFMQGAYLVSIDPKGDNHLDRLPGVAEHLQVIELSGSSNYAGLLDPMRIAPPDSRFDMTMTFLMGLIPSEGAQWRTVISEAVKSVVARAGAEEADNPDAAPPTTLDVLSVLESGDLWHEDAAAAAQAKAAARQIRVYSDMGLAQLGFAPHGADYRDTGSKQVTILRVRDLPLPQPNTPRDQLREDERVGQVIIQLMAVFAMHLLRKRKNVHKVLTLDEAWFLLSDAGGRKLIEHLARWGRSEFATLLMISHLAADAEDMDNLIGARIVGRMQSLHEARLALRSMGMDEDDLRAERLCSEGAYGNGRCILQDFQRRTVDIQFDPGQMLLDRLTTTPTGHGDPEDVGLARA